MIEITLYNHYRQLVSRAAIVSVTEADASSQWHGIRSRLKLANGTTLESANTVSEIQAMLKGCSSPTPSLQRLQTEPVSNAELQAALVQLILLHNELTDFQKYA